MLNLYFPSRGLLALVLVAAPWAFGGVHETSQIWLFAGLLIALALAVPSMLSSDGPRRVPAALWVLVLAVAWGFVQLVPLPDSLAAVLSPGAPALRAELLPSADSPDAHLLGAFDMPIDSGWKSLSLRASATRVDLTLLVMAVVAFLLGWQLFRNTRAALGLYALVALNGVALALFGLVQKLTWNGQLYWIGPVPGSGPSAFGAFVNRNNAAGYMNLCLAAALCVTMWAAFRNAEPALGHAYHPARGRRGGWVQALRRSVVGFFARLDALQMTVFTLTACLIAGVLCTLSRGGAISLLVAGVVTALAVSAVDRRRGRVAWIVIALMTGLGLVAWFGMVDLLIARLDTLSDPNELASEGRLANWSDALQNVRAFWLVGSGLGTYRDVYLMHQFRYWPAWANYAENQYVQALIDAGVVGLLLLVAALLLVVKDGLRLLAGRLDDAESGGAVGGEPHEERSGDPYDQPSGRDHRRLALALAGLFALTSQAVHAAFDFGLYIPANMLLLAVMCGSITGTRQRLGAASSNRSKQSAWAAPRLWRPESARPVAIAVLLLVAGVWGWVDVNRMRVRDREIKLSDYSASPSSRTSEELRDAIRVLSEIAEIRTDDAELQYHLAKQWIRLYQIQNLQRIRGSTPPEVPMSELWERAGTTGFHAAVHELARADDDQGLREMRADPLVRDHLRPALEQLLLARAACPILAKVHLRLARLSMLVGDPAADRVHLERTVRVEPSSTYNLAHTGQLHAQAGRPDDACRDWRVLLTLDPNQLDLVLPWAAKELSDEQLVERMLPPSPAWLVDLAANRFIGPDQRPLRRLLLDRAGRLVDEVELPPDQRSYLRGRVLGLQERGAEAVEHYAEAVDLQPLEPVWRFEMATLLGEQGRYEEAHRQAVACVRLEPDNMEYQRLLEQITRARLSPARTLSAQPGGSGGR